MVSKKVKFNSLEEEIGYITDLYGNKEITISEELDMMELAMKKWDGGRKSHVCEGCQDG